MAATGRHSDAVEQALKWAADRPILDLPVYSDGALQEGAAGAGYCVFRGPRTEVASGTLDLSRLATIYDAEVVAPVAGAQTALRHWMAAYATDLTIYLNNEEAAIRLHAGRPTATSAAEFRAFEALREAWATRPLAGPEKAGQVRVR